MGGPVVVGVDVGTTAAKVSAFSIGASWRFGTAHEYPLLRPRPGWAEQDPDVVVAAVLQGLTETVAACGGAPVVAVALSSAMHGLIGLDADRRPLTPLVTWADARALAEAAALRAEGPARDLHRRSGTPVHPMAPLAKLLWFRRHSPDVFAGVRHWIGLKDWLVLSLTGRLVTELSTASGSGLLDLATRTWHPPALALAGVTADQLPPVLPTTATLPLAPDVAARVGLTPGTPVVLGAGDGPLGNVGTGALGPGVVSLSIGTSAALRAVVPRPVTDDEALFCYALTDDAWVVGGALSNGGSVQRWAGSVFGADPQAAPPDDEALLALAAAVPAGSDGLIALPFLLAERAPLWDPTLTGAFLGVQSHHTRGHFVRAALEGVAHQVRAVLTRLEAVTPVDAVRATGGVFRSPLWHRILTDVLDRPITLASGAEGTALGAAALGLLAVGRTASLTDALALLSPPGGGDSAGPSLTPDAAAAHAYREQNARLNELLDGCRRIAETRL